MHWFSCVPRMDFQYVHQVIEQGNPCKYWAPKGQQCPVLTTECYGNWCNNNAPVAAPPIVQLPPNNTNNTNTTNTTPTARPTPVPCPEGATCSIEFSWSLTNINFSKL